MANEYNDSRAPYENAGNAMTHKERKRKKGTPFGRIMLASAVGMLIVMVIIGLFKLFLFMGLISSLGSGNGNQTVVTDGTFLKIDLTKPITERSNSSLFMYMQDGDNMGFADLLRVINAAGEDRHIEGIYLYMGSSYPLSWGRSEELRKALLRFRENDKPVLVYADGYSQQGYFVASAADSIYLNPSGLVEFHGIGAEVMFYKEMLDRLAVKMTLVRPKSNSFKSAGETYTMDRMSNDNRKQISQYIGSIWEYATQQMASARDISIEDLNRMADNLSACLPEDALSNRIVDRLCFENDIQQTMKDSYNGKQVVTADNYVRTIKDNTSSKNRIAVIYAEGEVVAGTGVGVAVYSDNITRALDKAADDDAIKAIVLRINSPGGMVTASEIMTNAVARANSKKPVIVSMGDVAASAGYEMSCNATCIVAQPTTLTGSIGVFAALPEVGNTLKKYLGITIDTVQTNSNSTALSLYRPLSPQVLELMQRNVEDFYVTFVGRVANGRGMSSDEVDEVAKGRVWTGLDALKIGLVDELGGLYDAIAIAADKSGITDYKVVDYPIHDDIFTELKKMRDSDPGTIQLSDIMASGDGVWTPVKMASKTLKQILDTKGLQARVEFLLLAD